MVGDVFQALRRTAYGKGAALEYAFDVVAAHIEVGDGIETAEFDGGDVIGLSSFLLCAF